MALTPHTAPANEPVTIDDVRHYLRIDTTHDDTLLTALIEAARRHVEAATGRALITQTWDWRFDHWPTDGVAHLPLSPVSTINAITVTQADGTVLDLTHHATAGHLTAEPPRVKLATPTVVSPAPLAAWHIRFTAGYGSAPDTVPAPLRLAIRQLVAHWYENREPAERATARALPTAIADLIAPFRHVTLP